MFTHEQTGTLKLSSKKQEKHMEKLLSKVALVQWTETPRWRSKGKAVIFLLVMNSHPEAKAWPAGKNKKKKNPKWWTQNTL